MNTNSDFENFSTQQIEYYNKIMLEEGSAGLYNYITDDIDAWKSVKINVAVVGASGVGKSSFINAMIGLSPDDPGAAEVGVVETTKDRSPYKHPKNKNVTLWDIPGHGTNNFPVDTYLDKIHANEYDFFFVIGKSRFTENDIKLVSKLVSLNKRVYFVRTHTHLDIKHEKSDHPNTFEEAKILKRIKKDCKEKLTGIGKVKIFLIDNKKLNKYDFDKLNATLLKDVPQVLKEVFVNSFTSTGEDCMKVKIKILEKRIFKVSLGSALAGMLPLCITGVVDGAILIREFEKYKVSLGLESASLENHANQLVLTKDELVTKADLRSPKIKTNTDIVELSDRSVSGIIVKSLLATLSAIGSLASCILSFPLNNSALHKLLEIVHADAIKLNKFLADSLAMKIDKEKDINLSPIC